MTEIKGKYGDLLNKAKAGKPDSQQADKPDSQQTSKQAKESIEDKEVNLCVRVPESQRQWWAGQAKIQGTTMTAVIKEALAAKFGLPPQ